MYDTFLFERMKEHIGRGHRVRMVYYGSGPDDVVNISVECESCGVVLLDVEPDDGEVVESRKA